MASEKESEIDEMLWHKLRILNDEVIRQETRVDDANNRIVDKTGIYIAVVLVFIAQTCLTKDFYTGPFTQVEAIVIASGLASVMVSFAIGLYIFDVKTNLLGADVEVLLANLENMEYLFEEKMYGKIRESLNLLENKNKKLTTLFRIMFYLGIIGMVLILLSRVM
jgi:hypothetical protein